MTNQTPEVSIQVLDEDHDVAIAELTEIGIESFLQNGDLLQAYGPLLPTGVRSGLHALDAGTGTAILAIAACRVGAGSVFAFDNDPVCYENAVENFARNEVNDLVTLVEGGPEVIPQRRFDIILANIHLNVIEGMLPDICFAHESAC